MKKKRPLLSWKLEDYMKNGYEPPEELVQNPQKSEVELMTEEDMIQSILENDF